MSDTPRPPLSTDELEEIRTRYNDVCDKVLEALRIVGMGFTREDVDAIRLVHVSRPEIQLRLESIADRIEVLLAPEKPALKSVDGETTQTETP